VFVAVADSGRLYRWRWYLYWHLHHKILQAPFVIPLLTPLVPHQTLTLLLLPPPKKKKKKKKSLSRWSFFSVAPGRNPVYSTMPFPALRLW